MAAQALIDKQGKSKPLPASQDVGLRGRVIVELLLSCMILQQTLMPMPTEMSRPSPCQLFRMQASETLMSLC